MKHLNNIFENKSETIKLLSGDDWITSSSHLEVGNLKKMLANGFTDVNYKEHSDGNNAIFEMTNQIDNEERLYDYYKTLEFLIDNGVKCDYQNKWGYTPLILIGDFINCKWYFDYNNNYFIKILCILIENGCDISVKDHENDNFLDFGNVLFESVDVQKSIAKYQPENLHLLYKKKGFEMDKAVYNEYKYLIESGELGLL